MPEPLQLIGFIGAVHLVRWHSSHSGSSRMSQMICQSLVMWLLTDCPLVSITVSACARHFSNCVSYTVYMCECESLLELLLMIYILTLPSITACEPMCKSASHTPRFFMHVCRCTWENFPADCGPLFVYLYILVIPDKHLWRIIYL